MKEPSSAPGRAVILAGIVLLSAAVFALDLTTPVGVAAAALYVAIVLASLWSQRPLDTVIAAAIATGLTLLGSALSPPSDLLWTDLANRLLALFAIWATAVLSLQRKQAELDQARLIRELDHRVKNNLAAVLAVADQTIANSETLGDFTPAFAGRLRAMAIAHDLLARSGWKGATLREMIDRVVAPYRHGNPERFTLAGPDVVLPAEAVPSVSMVLQELAANAARHGALSDFHGCVTIEWDRALNSAESGVDLRLTWTERGGPPVRPPTRSGFGLSLIERMIGYQTKGRARIDFAEAGVRCEIVVPLEAGPPGRNGRIGAAERPERPET